MKLNISFTLDHLKGADESELISLMDTIKSEISIIIAQSAHLTQIVRSDVIPDFQYENDCVRPASLIKVISEKELFAPFYRSEFFVLTPHYEIDDKGEKQFKVVRLVFIDKIPKCKMASTYIKKLMLINYSHLLQMGMKIRSTNPLCRVLSVKQGPSHDSDGQSGSLSGL